MEFAHPWLLWAAPIVAVALYIRLRRKGRAVVFPGAAALASASSSWRPGLPLVLFAAAAFFLLAAAAGPRGDAGTTEETIRGVDVALALDVSASMRAEDFKPDRIEAAKSKMREFIEGFSGGRLALVAFAGRSFTQCPLTADTGILVELLDQLDVGSVAIDGTAIGDAVINALNKFPGDSGGKTIVLLTDGENNAGTVDPITAARAARDKGVKIYAIGVGTPEGAPIPAYGPMGQKYYITDQYGRALLARVDEKTLMEMADITGGEYFRAKDEDALGGIYKKISEMEKKEITVKKTRRYTELSAYPAAAGLLIALVGGALCTGRLRLLSGGGR